mmetsp:Transcript_52702/g.127771  ORF Transcript_52702/g.127771 Transcript_52702/m.127771 type:complete len:81 (-) Transcript_52702:60-302(-)
MFECVYDTMISKMDDSIFLGGGSARAVDPVLGAGGREVLLITGSTDSDAVRFKDSRYKLFYHSSMLILFVDCEREREREG